MDPDPNSSLPPPPPQRASNSGTLIVGIVAVVALILAAYALTRRAPAAAVVTTPGADLSTIEKRLDQIEQRVALLEAKPAPTAAMPRASSVGSEGGVAAVDEKSAATNPAPSGSVEGPFEVVSNADLKGRLGRLVIEFAEGTRTKDTRTDIYRAGSSTLVKTEYGNASPELVAASYDVAISGHRVANVTVKSRNDTRMAVGVLRLHGAKDTRFDILETGTQKKIYTAYGEADVGLAAGTYDLSVSGQTETITIKSAAVTEF